MGNILCNVGSTDRKIRIAIGLLLFITLFALQSWWWLGGVALLVSGLLEICPIYSIVGINTCKQPKKWWH